MTLANGTRLGPYEILAPLGAGGMGEVYRARDTRLEREVAVKVLPSRVSADPDRLRRFEKEARSASSLNHPNVVTVYDIGESGGTSFIAMELVDGRTLRELLAEGALPIKRLLAIARAAGRWPGPGAWRRDRAPGSQARERHGPQGRVREDPGLRPRQADADGRARGSRDALSDGFGGHGGGRRRGDGRLHVAGAGAREGARLPFGPVRVRVDPLRDGDGPAGVRARQRARDAGGDHPGGARGNRSRRTRNARAARLDRGALPRQGSGGALRLDTRSGPGSRAPAGRHHPGLTLGSSSCGRIGRVALAPLARVGRGRSRGGCRDRRRRDVATERGAARRSAP